MQKLLKWLSLFIVVSVTIFLTTFLYMLYKSDSNIPKPKDLEFVVNINDTDKKDFWLEDVSIDANTGNDDFLPVTEVLIKTSLVKDIKKTIKIYKIETNSLDPYQIFCLQEELNRFGVKYTFKKNKNQIRLYVISTNLKKLKKLVDVLKRYNIIATIKSNKKVNI